MRRDQYSRWNSVKAKHDYTCARCGSTDYIQAHAPNRDHSDWRKGVALCINCHAQEHPNVPFSLFTNTAHQPYWPNISARKVATELGVCSRTVIRRAKGLQIPSDQPLTDIDRQRLADLNKWKNPMRYHQKPQPHRSTGNPRGRPKGSKNKHPRITRVFPALLDNPTVLDEGNI